MRRFVLPLLLAAAVPLLAPAGARAQVPTPEFGGFFRMMTGAPAPTAFVDLKFYTGNPSLPVLATLLNPQGSYRLYFGTAARGGLGIYFVILREVKQPAAFLQAFDPANATASSYARFLGPQTCRFDLIHGPAYYDFGCGSTDPTQPSSHGRLERLPR